MQLDFSLILPAYNEAGRLPRYLAAIRPYLDEVFAGRYEVIVVDDGSQDGLAGVLRQWIEDWPHLSLHRHPVNQGKGAAVRTAMGAARGELLLFADADGATPIEEEWILRQRIMQGADVAVGSRLLPRKSRGRDRSWYRSLLGQSFAWAVRRLLPLPVRDTQCGFKMFRREAGLRLFALCQERGYLLDVEILAWAQRLGYRIAEAAIAWRDVPGSKVHMGRDPWRMLHGLWKLRRRLAATSEGRIHPVADRAPIVGQVTLAPFHCP